MKGKVCDFELSLETMNVSMEGFWLCRQCFP